MRFSIDTNPPRSKRESTLRLAVLAFLLVLVPILSALPAGADGRRWSRLAVLPELALIVAVVLINYRRVLVSPAHRAFFGLFGVLAVATIATWLRAGFGGFYSQAIGLINCFAWIGVYLVVHFVVWTRVDARWALLILDATAIVFPATVYLSYLGVDYLGFEFGEVLIGPDTVRAFGPFGDNVGFAMALFAARSAVQRRWLVLILNLSAILLTGTRGAMATVAVTLAWLAITGWAGPRRRRSGAIALVLWAAVSTVVFFASPYGATAWQRLEGLFVGEAATSLRQRTVAMEMGLRVFLDYPVLGVGYLGFNSIAQSYDSTGFIDSEEALKRGVFTAQNQYLQTATDGGIVGLGALVLFAWLLVRSLRRPAGPEQRHDDDVRAIRAFLIGTLLGNQGAVWILPLSIAGYYVFVAAGLAERLVALNSDSRIEMEGRRVARR